MKTRNTKAPVDTNNEGRKETVIKSNGSPQTRSTDRRTQHRPSRYTIGQITDLSKRTGPIIPDVLAGKGASTIAVYYAVKKHLNRQTGKCCPSLTQVCKESGCSRPTVEKAIRRIAELGECVMHVTSGHKTYYEFPDVPCKFRPWENDTQSRADKHIDESQVVKNRHCQQVQVVKNRHCKQLKIDTATSKNPTLEPNEVTNELNQSPKPPTGDRGKNQENQSRVVSKQEFNSTLEQLRTIALNTDYSTRESRALSVLYENGFTSKQILQAVQKQTKEQQQYRQPRYQSSLVKLLNVSAIKRALASANLTGMEGASWNENNSSLTSSAIPSHGYPKAFEDFWKSFPGSEESKGDKQTAFDEWRKIIVRTCFSNESLISQAQSRPSSIGVADWTKQTVGNDWNQAISDANKEDAINRLISKQDLNVKPYSFASFASMMIQNGESVYWCSEYVRSYKNFTLQEAIEHKDLLEGVTSYLNGSLYKDLSYAYSHVSESFSHAQCQPLKGLQRGSTEER